MHKVVASAVLVLAWVSVVSGLPKPAAGIEARYSRACGGRGRCWKRDGDIVARDDVDIVARHDDDTVVAVEETEDDEPAPSLERRRSRACGGRGRCWKRDVDVVARDGDDDDAAAAAAVEKPDDDDADDDAAGAPSLDRRHSRACGGRGRCWKRDDGSADENEKDE